METFTTTVTVIDTYQFLPSPGHALVDMEENTAHFLPGGWRSDNIFHQEKKQLKVLASTRLGSSVHDKQVQ